MTELSTGSTVYVSRFTGLPYRVSRRRVRRKWFTAILGRRPRPRQPTRLGCFTWLSDAERAQMAALTAQGWSGRAIARVMKRDRRTVDRWRRRLTVD